MSLSPHAVICLHSGGFTSRQWKRLAAELAATHRVLTPDLIGYGAEPWPAGKPFHYQQDVDAIVALVRTEIVDHGAPPHLVGHSYGGFLAAHVARVEPVKSLALYEPVTFSLLDRERDADAFAGLSRTLDWKPDATGVDEAWLASFVDWWNGRGAWQMMPAPTRDAFKAVGWKVFEEVRTLIADDTGAAGFSTITAPLLVMGGALSPLPERRVVERLASIVPHGTLRIFDGAGHMGPITHAPLVNQAIAAHIRAQS